MATDRIVDVIQSLTAEEQDAVLDFVEYLKVRGPKAPAESPFLRAAEEFIAQHPELLMRLAQ